MLGAKGRGQRRDHGERGRDRRDLEMPAQALLQSLHFLAHGAGVGDDAARPIEDALAFRGETEEARGALHQHDAQRGFELLDAGREGRLRHAALLGGPTEIALARQRQEILELVDHRSRVPGSVAAARAPGRCSFWTATRPGSAPGFPKGKRDAPARYWCRTGWPSSPRARATCET